MDDSTAYEIMDVHSHIPDTMLGYTQEKIDAVKSYAENEKEIAKKCLLSFEDKKRLFLI